MRTTVRSDTKTASLIVGALAGILTFLIVGSTDRGAPDRVQHVMDFCGFEGNEDFLRYEDDTRDNTLVVVVTDERDTEDLICLAEAFPLPGRVLDGLDRLDVGEEGDLMTRDWYYYWASEPGVFWLEITHDEGAG